MKGSWDLEELCRLAVGISICALSYYNAYGVILASVFFFGLGHSGFSRKTVSEGRKKIFPGSLSFPERAGDRSHCGGAGRMVVLRSYVIYDGDILGMKTSAMYSQMYAVEELKPSNRYIIADTGMTVRDMLFFVPGNWEHNWLLTVASALWEPSDTWMCLCLTGSANAIFWCSAWVWREFCSHLDGLSFHTSGHPDHEKADRRPDAENPLYTESKGVPG